MADPDVQALARLRDGSPNRWGAWGPDDEVGALSYLSAAKVVRGIARVRDGRVVIPGAPLVMPCRHLIPAALSADRYARGVGGAAAREKRL